MPWAKLDDQWPRDRKGKAIKAGPEGRDLYVCALCFCNAKLTDGFIPEAVVQTLAPGNRHSTRTADLLVSLNLWERVEGGFLVHDYHEYNQSSKQILAERQAAADRKNRWKERRGNAVPKQPGTTKERRSDGTLERVRNDAHARAATDTDTTPPPISPPLASRRYDWPSPELKASSLTPGGTHWLPGRYPFEAFHHDCPDPAWRGTCVRLDYAQAHPNAYPVADVHGAPKQCPIHRASGESAF